MQKQLIQKENLSISVDVIGSINYHTDIQTLPWLIFNVIIKALINGKLRQSEIEVEWFLITQRQLDEEMVEWSFFKEFTTKQKIKLSPEFSSDAIVFEQGFDEMETVMHTLNDFWYGTVFADFSEDLLVRMAKEVYTNVPKEITPIYIYWPTMSGKSRLCELLMSVGVKVIDDFKEWDDVPAWTQVIFSETPMGWIKKWFALVSRPQTRGPQSKE